VRAATFRVARPVYDAVGRRFSRGQAMGLLAVECALSFADIGLEVAQLLAT
jgi:hypothetical protein